MSMSVAYIGSGKLHLKYDGVAARQVDCKFADDVRERLKRMAERNAWKMQGTGA